MSADHGTLGGRLPLYNREALDPAQKRALRLAHEHRGPVGGGCKFPGPHPGGPAHRTIQPGPADPGRLVGLRRALSR